MYNALTLTNTILREKSYTGINKVKNNKISKLKHIKRENDKTVFGILLPIKHPV